MILKYKTLRVKLKLITILFNFFFKQKTVQGIINSLLISHIELRSDDSIDIQKYNHGRIVDKFILKLEGELLNILNEFKCYQITGKTS